MGLALVLCSVLLCAALGDASAGAIMSLDLFARIANGEQAAFTQCVNQYGGMIWSLARRFSATATDAEDAVQDVFLQLWKNAKHFDAARGSEAIFIATLARRILINRFRAEKGRRLEIGLDDFEAQHDPPGENGNGGEICVEAQKANAALATLPGEQRRVIQLSVVNGLSQSEIAAETGLPLGTVKTLMRRGLLMVRDKLGLLDDHDKERAL